MCRFLVYKGSDEILLSKLILDPTHSILKQSFDSRLRLDTRRGQNNADGFGLGWYTDAKLGPGPCVFRSTTPAWNCTNLARIASKTASHLIFGHVRATTEGSLSEDNCHPFYHGSLIWMHNGGLGGWKYIKRRLSERLADRWYLGVQGGTDSEWAFALFLDTLERMGHDPSAGATSASSSSSSSSSSSPSSPSFKGFGPTVLRQAMLHTIRYINELTDQIPESVVQAENVDTRSLLNFVVTDGHSVICTRYISSSTDEAASLYYSSGTQWETRTAAADDRHYHMERHDKVADVVLVASEPLTFERENWVNVATNSILTIHNQTVMVHPIIDEYYDADPAHLRSSTFVQTRGLVSNEKPAPAQGSFAAPAIESSCAIRSPSLAASRCVVGAQGDGRNGRSARRPSTTLTALLSSHPPSLTLSQPSPSEAAARTQIYTETLQAPSTQLSPPSPAIHHPSPSPSSSSTPSSENLAPTTTTSHPPRHAPSERNISRKRAALPASLPGDDDDDDDDISGAHDPERTSDGETSRTDEFGHPKKLSRYFPELSPCRQGGLGGEVVS